MSVSTNNTPNTLTGRAAVRNTLYNFLYNPPVTNLNQVFTSFPKRINFQVNSQAGQLSRSAVIIFIQSETESRLAIGGAHNGWKRIDYSIILQVYQHSLEPDSQAAMESFDTLIYIIK